MKLITVQHKNVLRQLALNKIYKADFSYLSDPNKFDYTTEEITELNGTVSAYQLLMRHYGLNYSPVFCCVIDRHANFSTTKSSKHHVLLELDVPDEVVNLHVFYSWLDFLFACQRSGNMATSYDDCKYWLDGYGVDSTSLSIQAILPCIKPEWLHSSCKQANEFLKSFIGGNILPDLQTIYKSIK